VAKYGVKKIGVIRCGNGLSTPPKFSLKDLNVWSSCIFSSHYRNNLKILAPYIYY